MFTPNSIPYQRQPGFQRTYRQGRLTLGLFFPLEAFAGDTPSMLDQASLAQRADKLGFSALWFRDVPLRDPSFGDSGQVFDPWVYLGFMAAHTLDCAGYRLDHPANPQSSAHRQGRHQCRSAQRWPPVTRCSFR